ncbi:ATP-binding protein [Bacteroides pyogenes]|uniref:ATP-binding protein n=1 Tax=Bacteroides pyogenes TaxID=310300 RepID=UPI002FDB3592
MRETVDNLYGLCGKFFLFLIPTLLLLAGCSSRVSHKAESREYYLSLENKLKDIKHEESLKELLEHYRSVNDRFALMLCYKQLGKIQRENARFSDAIASHQEGLTLAYSLTDTIEIVQALNNLGTNFRRIGALAEAADYHYRALEHAEAYSGKLSPEGKKNRVVSMNGIGNVSLTLGYYDDAEKFFRLSLSDEIALKSPIGQAINLANLGAIFEEREQYDSAEVYYRRSMEQNRIGDSEMGMGLCNIHLGHLYKKQKLYATALEHYTKAYEQMDRISDRWHWLEACIAMAEIHLLTHNDEGFNRYITRAEQTATEISSPEHLVTIYRLQHDFDFRLQHFDKALKHYKASEALEDSVRGVQKANRYIDLRLNFERDKNTRSLQRIEAENGADKMRRQITLYLVLIAFAFALIVLLLLWYAYRQRLRSNRILRQVERARTDFFTGITHEFRTPITIIRGLNEQLKDRHRLSESDHERYIQVIDRQSNRLLSLVNQLLDITRLQSGSDRPQWKRGDIVNYLRMSVENYQLYAERKQIQLNFQSGVLAQEMDFVPFYIDKVVSNLISNAIKHTPEGGRIDFRIDTSQNETLLLCVSDTGVGIDPEDLPRIFELFYHNERSTDDMGTGIGLSFTRLLVEKMNGKIEVESTPGKGAAFTVRLPLYNRNKENILRLEKSERPVADSALFSASAIATANTERTDEYGTEIKPAANANPNAPLLLIVEDNADVRLYLQTLLSPYYRLLTAADGEEGLAVAREHLPDLIVTDIMMPRKDGIALCTELKQDVLINHIPVIMLTARSTDEDRIAGLRCGVEAYIRKPFQAEELFITINNLLTARRLLQEKYTRLTQDTAFFTGSSASQENRMPHEIVSAHGNSPMPMEEVPPIVAASPENNVATSEEERLMNDCSAKDDATSATGSGIPAQEDTKTGTNAVERANLDFLNDVVALIDSHIEDPQLTPTFVASHMLLSLSQLNRKLNAITGAPTSLHILRRRLIHARRMLGNPRYSIMQVADLCGFTDSSHLSRAFKKEYGITPTAYRNQ